MRPLVIPMEQPFWRDDGFKVHVKRLGYDPAASNDRSYLVWYQVPKEELISLKCRFCDGNLCKNSSPEFPICRGCRFQTRFNLLNSGSESSDTAAFKLLANQNQDTVKNKIQGSFCHNNHPDTKWCLWGKFCELGPYCNHNHFGVVECPDKAECKTKWVST